jgi:tRNA1Val (adenine37-N6)-methyltransferase
MQNEFFSENLYNNTLLIKQPAKGYRFSIDALILANQVKPNRACKIIDLGTGCGIIALILSRKFPDVKISGIEIQSSLAKLAQGNVIENKLEDQINIICGDMKCLSSKDIEGPVDIVVVNPPFGKSGHVRVGNNPAESIAKHEIFVSLSDILAFSVRVLKVSGILYIIYPAKRLAELFYDLCTAKLEPKWFRTVHPRYQTDATRVIVKSVKHGRKGITIGSPLYIYGADGSYTSEVEKMFKI